MALASFDPSRALVRLQEALDRLHGNPNLGLTVFGSPGLGVFPPLNVFLDGDTLVVIAEVPGFRRDQVSISIEARRLVLSGERKAEPSDAEGGYHRRERQFGTFERSLQLPDDLDTEAATAECRDGVLTVRVPRRPERQARKIEITHH